MELPERLVVATFNRGKLKEIEHIWRRFFPDVRLLGLWEFEGIGKPVESGDTFEENACEKAVWAVRRTGLPAIADDSGIEVAALGGLPGVRSARFAGEGASDADNNALLLKMLDGVPRSERAARFVCVAAYADGNGSIVARARGECSGFILDAPRGTGGFGYDPLFWVPEYGKTFAELPPEVKNSISHRAKAFSRLAEMIRDA